jgi:hypothetical protein
MLFALLRLSVEAQAEGEVGNPLENLERRIARLEERLDEIQRCLPNPKFPGDAVGGTVLLGPLVVFTPDHRVLLELTSDEHGTRLNLYDGSMQDVGEGPRKEIGQGPAIILSASPDGQRSITVYDKDGAPIFYTP